MSVTTIATIERQAAALQRQIREISQTLDYAAKPKRSVLDLAAELNITLDSWQRAALSTERHDVLLLVTRQGGKGMVASLLALDKMLNDPGSTTVIVSRADRQAKRLLRRVKRLYRQLADVPPVIAESVVAIELRNGSELLALPGSEETIRGIEAVDLLVIDEAALVPDDLFAAVHPMLATTDGRCVAISTARGKRGWFWREWESADPEWHRAKVTAPEISRIKPQWLERYRERHGDFMYRQEFLCEFLDDETQVYATDLVHGAVSADVAPLFGGA
jgi:hypothetical protein